MTHRATTRLLVRLVTAGAVVVAAPGIVTRSATGAGTTASASAVPTVAGSTSAVAPSAGNVGDDRVPAVPSAPIPAPPVGIYMVTDSVGLGAKAALPAAFPGQRVVVDGTPALFVEMLESRLVQPRIAADPSLFTGGIAVVAGGYNYPYWDPARFDRSIDSIVGTLRAAGVRQILWVTLREVKPEFISASAWRQVQPYYWYFPTVNTHLRAALARHPDLTLVDWAAVADQPGLTYDAIHLNPVGAALYSATIAETVAAVTTRVAQGSVTPIQVAGAGGVPADATAVMLNLTAVGARTPGYLTAFPCGRAQPFTANRTFTTTGAANGAAIVEVGDGGRVCVFTSAATNLVVDVQGWFSATDGVAPVGPVRAIDTRDGGAPPWPRLAPVEIDLDDVPGMPPDASAVVLNITVTEPTLPGYATAYPCGVGAPLAANLNYLAGATVPNMAVVAPGAGRKVCVIMSQPAHVVVDVLGALSAAAPLTIGVPARQADTRETGRLAAGATLAVPVVGRPGQPSAATGALLNVTAVDPAGPGFLTAYPCGEPLPPTSTLNTVSTTIGNFALVGPGADGAVCVTTSVETDVVVDLSGWTDGFHAIPAIRALDTRTLTPSGG